MEKEKCYLFIFSVLEFLLKIYPNKKEIKAMPENEFSIAYTEVRKLVKQTSNKSRLIQLDNAIDQDQTGIIYAYRKGDIAFEIKRYRTGRFIKRVY
jgi:hypothetical protein